MLIWSRNSLASVQFCSHCTGFRLIRWARRPSFASRLFMSNNLISNQRGENPFWQKMFLQISLNHSVLLEAPNNYSHANFNTLISFLIISTWDIWKLQVLSVLLFTGRKDYSACLLQSLFYSRSLLPCFPLIFLATKNKERWTGCVSLTLDEIYAHKEKICYGPHAILLKLIKTAPLLCRLSPHLTSSFLWQLL